MATSASWLVVLLVSLLAGTRAHAGPCRRIEPRATKAATAPSRITLSQGTVELRVLARDEDTDTPVAGVPIEIGWTGHTGDPIRLTSDRDGFAIVVGLPLATYEIFARNPWSERGGRHVTLASAHGVVTFVLPVPSWPLVVAQPLPHSALPRDVVLRYEQTGCLGPCPAFTVDVGDDGRAWKRGVDAPRTWKLGRRRLRRALARARCMAAGPSFDAIMATDAHWVIVHVRDGDGVAVYRHYFHDFRAPRTLERRERRLARALRLRHRSRS